MVLVILLLIDARFFSRSSIVNESIRRPGGPYVVSWFVRGLQIALRSVKTARGCVTKSHVADRQGQRRLNFIARMRRWRKRLPDEKWQHNETADTALNKKKTLGTQGKNSMCRENTSLRTGGEVYSEQLYPPDEVNTYGLRHTSTGYDDALVVIKPV